MLVNGSSALARRAVALALAASLGVSACTPGGTPMTDAQLHDLATRYAAAWSGGEPGRLAAFYAEDGSLAVNDGAPAVGRPAVAAKAEAFMLAVPDMVVRMDSVTRGDGRATFHWTWTGTNTGPGGTGRPVRITGYETWTLAPDGLIRESKGHYDEAEYDRQVRGDATPR
jgi:hypothetical protein